VSENTQSIKIHVMHTGEVCVAPDLPFGGDKASLVAASGLFTKKDDRLWLPVSVYLIEHPEHGLILVDTGWSRSMSPEGEYDRTAQIHSLGSAILYKVNQGVLPRGEAVDEQLTAMGIEPSDLDLVLITHLDCDHANGLRQVKDAKRMLVAADEVECAHKNAAFRYRKRWWQGVNMEQFEWNDEEGPFRKSYNVFGDGSIVLVNIPGHADGLFAVKVNAHDGHFALLFSDGGYAAKSWQEMLTSGIALDKEKQKASLAWIREQSLDPLCVESLANHDPDVVPYTIEL